MISVHVDTSMYTIFWCAWSNILVLLGQMQKRKVSIKPGEPAGAA